VGILSVSAQPYLAEDVTQQVKDIGLAMAYWIVRRQASPPARWPFQILCLQSKGVGGHLMPPIGWTVPQAYRDAGQRFVTARALWEPKPGAGSIAKIPSDVDLGNVAMFVGVDAFVMQTPQQALAAAPPGERLSLPSRPVLGVIDGPSDYDHPQWADRVRHVWHMEEAQPLAAPWQPNPDFPYGYTLKPEPGAAKPDYGLPTDHANAVIALGAGAVDPVDPERASAGLADLVIVHLPSKALTQTHGLWLNVYVLDAVRFILDKAPADAPVVINLSVGAYGGLHDGRSLLEQALDELIERERGRLCIVMAAGNTQQMHLHAQTVLAEEQSAGQRLELPGDMHRTAVLEAYLSGPAQVELVAEDWPMESVRLSPGQGNLGQAFEWRHAQTGRCVALASLSRVAQGYRLLMLWGGREAADGSKDSSWRAPEGRWALRWTAQKDLQVDAFLWRHDDIEGADEQQIEFIPGDPQVVSTSLMAGACYGKHAIVVGALEVDGKNAELADYSPGGPGLGGSSRKGPDLCTQGHVTFPDEGLTLRGTSMAAPIVARRICALYCAEKSALSRTEILALLQKNGPLLDQGQDVDPSRAGLFWLSPQAL